MRVLRMLALSLLVLLPSLGAAEVTPDTAGFTVRAILPDNQLQEQTYFSLLTQPGQTQTLAVEVENFDSEPLTLTIDVTDAYTSRHGLIAYGTQADQASETNALPDMLHLDLDPLSVGMDPGILFLEENQITVAPHATVRLPFRLSLPDTPIEGQLLGGIVLTKVDQAAEAEASSFAINSVFSYAIAVQLQAKDPVELPADFTLNGAAIESLAGYPALSLAVQNNAALVISGATLSVQAFSKGEQNLLIEKSQMRISMAPNSTMDYILPLGDDNPLPPGEYTIQMEITFAGQTYGLVTPLVVKDDSVL